MALKDHRYNDDDEEQRQVKPGQAKFTEFDCPGCNANNPVDAGFGHKSEVLCNYCGMEWEVRVTDELTLEFKER